MQIDEAAALLDGIESASGSGRESHLLELKQMEARVRLLKNEPTAAGRCLREALAYAAGAKFVPAEEASLRTDEVQLLIVQGRQDEAAEALRHLTSVNHGRDAEVFCCLADFCKAWAEKDRDETIAREALVRAVRRASAIRYDHFFRLIPGLAAGLCELALRWHIDPQYVTEIVRARDLHAPSNAGLHWPWRVWIRVVGRFELRIRGEAWPSSSESQQKAPHKRLELLRLLACSNHFSRRIERVQADLWPEAATKSLAEKSFEMTLGRLRDFLGDRDRTIIRVHDGVASLDPHRVSSDWAMRQAHIAQLRALAGARLVVERNNMPPSDRVDASQMVQQLRTACDLAERLEMAGSEGLLPEAQPTEWLGERRAAFQAERDLAINAAESLYAATRAAEFDQAASALRSSLMLAIERM